MSRVSGQFTGDVSPLPTLEFGTHPPHPPKMSTATAKAINSSDLILNVLNTGMVPH